MELDAALEAVPDLAPLASEGFVNLRVVDKGESAVGCGTPGDIRLKTDGFDHLKLIVALLLGLG